MKYFILGICIMNLCRADHRLKQTTDNFTSYRHNEFKQIDSGKNATLSLRIHRIECLNKTDSTNTSQTGADRIYLAGFKIDADASVSQIKPFAVGEFKTSFSKEFDRPRPVYSFYLPGSGKKLRSFSVGIVLFEKDKGSMGEIMQRIYSLVKKEIIKKRVNYQADENTPLTDNPVSVGPVSPGKLWELAKPDVYSYINKNIVGHIGDQLFPIHDVTITLKNNDHNWGGNKTSPVSMITFKGYGGEYRIFYDWEIK